MALGIVYLGKKFHNPFRDVYPGILVLLNITLNLLTSELAVA